MDNPEYEKFLLDVADDVESLVAVPEKRKRFEQQSRDLGKKQAVCSQVRGAKQMPPDPLLGFIPTSNGEPPPLKIGGALAIYYFLLATIHDKMREEYIPINNNIWSKRLAKSVWPIVENLYVDKQFIIKSALEHVKVDLAGKEPTATKKIVGPTSNITTEDIDKLLELFRQLENLLNPELPQRDGQLWVKAMEQSRKELADKLKKRQSEFTLRPGRNNLKRKSIKAGHSKKEEQAERIIRQMAENKYRLWDSKYDQSLSQVEEKIVEVVKRIDHTLYSMKEPLLAFDRTQGTLLQANFRNIRDDFTVNEIRQFQDQDMVKKSIDALQAIRLKVERQQRLEAPIKNQVSPNKKNAKGSMLKMTVRSSKDNWEAIKSE